MPAIGTPVAANTSVGASLTLPCLCLPDFGYWTCTTCSLIRNAVRLDSIAEML